MNPNMDPATMATDKATFLRSLAPLFPDVSDTEAQLQAIERDLPEREAHLQRHFRAAEEIYFPLWQALAPAYVATLSEPFGSDPVRLQVNVEDWPSSLEAHQRRLQFLLEQSRLRQAWRDYGRWFKEEFRRTNDTTQKDSEQERCRKTYHPLREIPLYRASMRVSCQQLVCLPAAQWLALNDEQATYQPEQVDEAVVERLAKRVAQVFNAPPFSDVDLLRDYPGWDDPVVWTVSSGNLTQPMSGHGMQDRCEHGWPGEIQALPAEAVAPHWRYEGFYGQLRVTLESGEDWIVAVLAPVHFLRRMAYSVEWFKRAYGDSPPGNTDGLPG